jgi:hypothetical protein
MIYLIVTWLETTPSRVAVTMHVPVPARWTVGSKPVPILHDGDEDSQLIADALGRLQDSDTST